MERWEQYEIWKPIPGSSRWELVAAFRDFDVASAVAKERVQSLRLVHAIYEGNKLAEHHVIAEIGRTRQTA
jgi:hypothetical protein